MKGSAYRYYLLALLMVILALNNADGLALGLALQNIKFDLHLSDTQLGFLSGIAFTLFYAVMGIPIARWADRSNRIAIITVTTALWSVMVALCGRAVTFHQLLLVRVGVAVGEAGCIPPAYSLIADHFSRGERPRAVAIYLLGGNLSFVIGYLIAGQLNEIYGWRMMFLMLGIPGLVPAALAWFTLREPRGSTHDGASKGSVRQVVHLEPSGSQASEPSPPLREVIRVLWNKVTFRHLLFSFAVASFFSSGVLQWLPAFFVRSYGIPTGRLGLWFGAIWGLGGLFGTYLGGELASRLAANNERLQLRAMALAYCSFAVFSALIYVAPTYPLALGAMGIAVTGLAMTNGPVLATIQTLVPARMRATSIATIYLFSNLIGMGLGPLTVGALSDGLRSAFGQESLRYALLAMAPGYLWGGWHLWRGSKTVANDLEVEADQTVEDGHMMAATSKRGDEAFGAL